MVEIVVWKSEDFRKKTRVIEDGKTIEKSDSLKWRAIFKTEGF